MVIGCSESERAITIAVYDSGAHGPISGPLYHWRATWQERSGYRLNVVTIPYEDLHRKFLLALRNSLGLYDGLVGPGWFYGDYLVGDYIRPVDEYMKDPKFPPWDPQTILPALRPLHRWAGKQYGCPNDSDAHILYYRKDILAQPKYQKRYHERYGEAIPVPPTTWTHVQRIADLLNGVDWDDDGRTEYGISIHLEAGGQGLLHFMSFSAPYAVLPGDRMDRWHNVYWFDPETFEPLIGSPGHVRALERMIELAKAGPKVMRAWSLEEVWELFLQGDAVFCHARGDLGWRAQDVGQSKVRGKLGCVALPGAVEVCDGQTKSFRRLSKPNVVGNTIGPSWHGVISRFTKHPDVVYDLFAFHASKPVSLFNALHGWTGVDPGRTFHFPPPNGSARIEDYTDAGWDPDDMVQYTSAYYETFTRRTQLAHLRIPNAKELYGALDMYIAKAVGGVRTPADAIVGAAEEWKRITKRLGNEKLLKFYRESIGYEGGK